MVNIRGQVTVIEGRRGPVWVGWTRQGGEFDALDRLRSTWRTDAAISACWPASRAEAVDLFFDLVEAGYWREGRLYERRALAIVLGVLKEVANDNDGE